jgi:signal transduction histidine kinase
VNSIAMRPLRSLGSVATRPLLARHGSRLLALMLFLLHAAFIWGRGEAWGQAVTLAHYGIFLLWQPFFSGAEKLPWPRALGVLAVGLWLAAWPSDWASAFWCVILAALLGGIALGLHDWKQRLGLWLAVIYLLAMLLLWMVPQLFHLAAQDAVELNLWRDSLLLLPVVLAFLPGPQIRQSSVAADLLYAIMLFLLVGVLILGSFVAMRLSESSYPMGVLISSSALVLAMVLFSWLWSPRGEFAGLGSVFSRYLLSMGLPLEEWLKNVAQAAENENDPEIFIKACMQAFTSLPGATGVSWKTRDSEGVIGQAGKFRADFGQLDVQLAIHSNAPLNPAFDLHLRLLTDVLGYFYAAKVREKALHANAYTQAIFETGSRLTHDVKNMLQSLRTLCSAAEHSGPDQAIDLQTLVQRQLPQIAKRLEITLDKLKSPQKAQEISVILAREWWRNLRMRYATEALKFEANDLNAEIWLPQELFDSVADNLLQNALRKRRQNAEVNIHVLFMLRPVPQLTVCDDGEEATRDVEQRLFNAPVSTHDGLGIGLYQAGKQASGLGYRLELSVNRPGRVCFTLTLTDPDQRIEHEQRLVLDAQPLPGSAY